MIRFEGESQRAFGGQMEKVWKVPQKCTGTGELRSGWRQGQRGRLATSYNDERIIII